MLLLVFSLLCLSDTWKLGLIVIVQSFGTWLQLLMFDNVELTWHFLTLLTEGFGESLRSTSGSGTFYILPDCTETNMETGCLLFSKMNVIEQSKAPIGFYQLPTIWLIVNLQWLSQGLCRTDHLSRMGAMQEASTSTRDPEDKTKTRHFHQVNIWLRKVNTSWFKVTCLSEQIFDNQ